MAPSSSSLEGKVAIITGGASGIGESTVHLFWENGAKVVIADIQDELGLAISSKLGENVCYIHCDVSNEEDIINLIDTTVARFGHLDIMFNNAGIVDRPFGSILDSTKSDLERLLCVNVVGSFLGAKHAARVMVPQRKGCILFTASACASIAGKGKVCILCIPTNFFVAKLLAFWHYCQRRYTRQLSLRGMSTHPYAISKHGIVGLCKNLAAELGQHGIRVNCISPSGMVTGSTARMGLTVEEIEERLLEGSSLKGKVLRVGDVAKAALYLASDDSGYVSGLDLVIDGGFSIVNPTIMKAVGLIQ
ncbi:hypothetical protein RJ640_014133 [Escallonia rubra]|uniref:Uncharacterized protein n=1 Tax=Escallonia rubra TaxID=112253 RepID=A0AA88RQE5_9ASTE|nr:hypothetical protein RJ640_014133 [Escallonia rubra]